MKTPPSRPILPRLACLALALLGLRATADAQIYYVNFDAQANGRLRQINANGTGDAAIPLPFTSVSFPRWTRDGNTVALTAVDPAANGQRSTNIFAFTPATGAISQLTNYTDIFDPTPGSNAFSYTFPLYKAFSPDRSSLAVFSLVFTAAQGGSTNSILPVLQVYSPIGQVNPTLVLVDTQRNGTNGGHHGGEGVDWSPTQNTLIAPLSTSAPYQNGSGSRGEVTAIFLIAPVQSALQTGQVRQVTFPRTDFNISAGTLVAEHDYMPRFSPNGALVAYARSFQSSSVTSQFPNLDRQSLRILNVNTGAETQLAQFPQGIYISNLDWSPDGSVLTFDLGQQPTAITGPQQQASPATQQTYVINADGSGLRQLLGNGNGYPSWRPTVTSSGPTSSLINLSTRARVETGDNVMIGGFVIGGSSSKRVLIRALGPSLAAANVPNVLANPTLTVFNAQNQPIASNDDWRSTAAADVQATGLAPTDNRESAVIVTLAPGGYTAIVSGVGGTAGVGLVEVYDLDTGSRANARPINVSTRARVQTGDNVMIGGFVVGGTGSRRVIVRALGPSLAAAGVPGALADPTLSIINGQGQTIATNDNWKATQQTEITASRLAPTNDAEAAAVLTLAPGGYTAIVSGKNGGTGVALVEIYDLD